MNKFKSAGSVENKFGKKHQACVQNKNIETDVMLSVGENPEYSLRKRSKILNVSKSTIAWIVKSNKFEAYKPRFSHTLKKGMLSERSNFVLVS